ncbi:hypothetical protein VPH35_049364 [Triticum aestivum]
MGRYNCFQMIVTQFLTMESLLDESVGSEINLQIERGGTPLTVKLKYYNTGSCTHMMVIRSGHSSFGGGGGAAPMMVDSSDFPSRIHGDEARPRLEPPPICLRSRKFGLMECLYLVFVLTL